ncbi:phosphoribosylanthranilate isomerase [Ferroplasma acidiphilum]|uniref:phosphoribosylanthranilate isomerase n=1 Tax=Ferroplasma acidiphilum TaxID=74969 RepID=UPI0023F0060D|nr:phosphoribosylanthranilate isomerase [Ferroplasma acidiphilum]
MKVKVCGITRIEDAEYAIKMGADLIGVILDPEVGRHGSQALIKEIKTKYPYAPVAGVYTSMPEHAGYEDYIQLHFSHSESNIIAAKRAFNKKIISVIDFHEEGIADKMDSHMKSGAEIILLEDRSGIINRIDQVKELPRNRLGIAGKIDSNNVQKLLATEPYLVDVSSSLEEYTGKKSFKKIDEFFNKIGEYYAVRQNQ